ncbi:MAG: D-TA family PLP-dependent enzyme [Acidimicrobiia bacterium]|nr:D-TA family PLP-dependent enzyme [Acidimicrobiia bacterium]
MASSTFDLPEQIDTPTVVVDIDILERNIITWARRMDARSVGLRPHTKTSKCVQIVQRQVNAGVVGLTVATLGEAESLAAAGFDELFQAYPLWVGHSGRADRLRALHERVDFMVGVESVEAAGMLGAATRGSDRRLAVLIEVNSGLDRSGVEPEESVRIARAASDAGLEVRGAFTFGGHAYADPRAAPAAGDDEVIALSKAAALLSDAGFEPKILSAGSTPTAFHSARPPVTEERPGTYVFNDAQQLALGVADLADVALVVAATVVASHPDGRFVLDAGSKAIAADKPPWVNGHGLLPAYPEAELRSLSEHHCVCWTTGRRPAIGEVVAVIPNHACVVVNLVDSITVVSRGQMVDRWPIVSRGRNS